MTALFPVVALVSVALLIFAVMAIGLSVAFAWKKEDPALLIGGLIIGGIALVIDCVFVFQVMLNVVKQSGTQP